MTRWEQRLGGSHRAAERWDDVALGEAEPGVWGCRPSLAPRGVLKSSPGQ